MELVSKHTFSEEYSSLFNYEESYLLQGDIMTKYQKYIDDIKQEAHGPHRLPEKTVQINIKTHMIIS